MNQEIQNQTAIVTGGAQGIGYFTTHELLKHGYSVVIADNDQEAGQEALASLKNYSRLAFVQTDVSSEQDIHRLTELTMQWFGRIDLLVNNAAIAINKPVTTLTFDEWNKVIQTNLTGTFLCAKHTAEHLKITSGSIINICSTRALMSEKNTEAYTASKGGIYSLTHALAVSLGPEIRVNSISPGWIEVSDIKKKENMQTVNHSAEDHSQHPAGRVGKPSDISSLILYLASKENSFITGQNFVVDGGMTKKMIYV